MSESDNKTDDNTEESPKKITMKEVSEHNKKNDCWIVIRDKVYEVTDFLDEHPGGREVLIDVAGKNATQDFEDVGHSTNADEIMKKYYIGDLVNEENEAPTDVDNVPVAFTSCFKSFKSIKTKFGFK